MFTVMGKWEITFDWSYLLMNLPEEDFLLCELTAAAAAAAEICADAWRIILLELLELGLEPPAVDPAPDP